MSSDEHTARELPALDTLLLRQTRALEALARPYILTDVYPKQYVNTLYFRVRNVGNTPAFSIQLATDTAVPVGHEVSSNLTIFQRPIPALAPGEEIAFFLNSAVDILGKDDSVRRFVVRADYTDATGRQYQEENTIDLELLQGLAIYIPVENDLLRGVERVQRSVETISRYFDDIRRRRQSRALRLRDQAENTEQQGSDAEPEEA